MLLILMQLFSFLNLRMLLRNVLSQFFMVKCFSKSKSGDPYFLFLNCNQHDKMKLFAKFKKFCEGGSGLP